MEKRFILAVALSFLVLFVWSNFVYKPQPPSTPSETLSTASPSAVTSTEIPQQPVSEGSPAECLEGDTFDLQVGDRTITFSENWASIKQVKFQNYQNYDFVLNQGFLLRDPKAVFHKQTVNEEGVIFTYADSQKRVTKKYKFTNNSYDIYLELEIENISPSGLSIDLPLLLANLDLSTIKDQQMRLLEVTAATDEKTSHANIHKISKFEGLKFLGFKNRYFCGIIAPEKFKSSGFVQKENKSNYLIGLNLNDKIQSGQKISTKYHIYLGPQDVKVLSAINPEWVNIMNYGTFDFISQILLKLLEMLHKVVRNWGIAIILLSILIYAVLYPLSIKQLRSMKELQAIQPKIDELRKLYKDNPQRLNKETIELYREHKVNPFGGCLPLLLQIPIFFALYQALMRSIALKGAKFLWISDLSEPDRLFALPVSLPVLGNEFNILPILMLIGMFFQQKLSMQSASSGSAEQQKIMMIVMPIMFGLIFYHMPSGLVLYWFVNNILMLVNQVKISMGK